VEWFQLTSLTYQLEQAPQVDKDCPIEQGEFTANKTVQLPKDIPPVRKDTAGCELTFKFEKLMSLFFKRAST
jgi:hypothetical protein